MTFRDRLGGVVHTYQGYDPQRIPSPTQPPPDTLSPALDHLLMYGDLRELTEDELARAVKLDPSQIAGLGPSLDALMAMLRSRKEKILAKYETETVVDLARDGYRSEGSKIKPPPKLKRAFTRAFNEEQLRELEQLWYRSGDERSKFARQLVQLVDRLGDKYQVDELAAKYHFTGRTSMTIPEAIAIKEELEAIDRLLEQLEEAAETAQIGLIDLAELAQFAEVQDVENLSQLQQQVQDYLNELAGRQGLEATEHGYQLTPKAYRTIQGRLLDEIFSELEASRSGRHDGPVVGEGAVEMQTTKPYEFGDSLANLDIPGTMINAMLRGGPSLPIRLTTDDIEIHRTRNNPRCATTVVMDMSGSMRYGGQYVDVKRMAIALQGLIQSEYPGDFLRFIEMATFARIRHFSEIASLLPKPVTLFDPIVRLKADMSDENLEEFRIPPHFTNIQHGLRLARQLLAGQDTPNRQIILITDGLPTAHFEEEMLYLLYPPDPATEQATMREGMLCQQEQITINIFVLPGWSQSEEDVRFTYRLAESTKGRVFFAGGRDLERFVVWDYLLRRRRIIS